MSKIYCSLGLMSGTSMDGVDSSIIQSDGNTKYKVILNKYFEYPKDIFQNLTELKNKIKSSKDLKKFSKQIKTIEKEITLFHAQAVNEILEKIKVNIDYIGFHGQTIFHSPKEKISKQLGDGKLLSQLTKKKVVYDFRQNDLKNGGQGAPLTPIFHKMLDNQFNLRPIIFVNIGGIINVTTIFETDNFLATDIGPGMCLIDKWIRINSEKKYDVNGSIARAGKIDITLNFALENFFHSENYDKKNTYIKSFDTNDFDISFVRGLSFENGAATLTEYTAQIILRYFFYVTKITQKSGNYNVPIILCGGGRKNNFLVERIKKNKISVKLIDDLGIDGDFVESQAFAYLAIRSYLKLPISFPETTGCEKPCTGGIIVKNF